MSLIYQSMFNEAMSRSLSSEWPELNAKFVISHAFELDYARIHAVVAEDLADGIVSDTWGLTGRCFLVARELSHVLFDLKIPHAITIGNVIVDGTPYFTTTLDSLKAEFRDGYIGNTPANAHCWLTLPDGAVLDASILPSIAHKNGALIAPSFHDAVHIWNHGTKRRFEYLPMLTGFHYHFSVVTNELLDKHFDTYAEWVNHYNIASQLSWWQKYLQSSTE